MKLILLVAGVLVWTAPVLAETYSWVDENGTYNFTEEYSRVPKKYRGKVDKRGDMGASPVPKESETTKGKVVEKTESAKGSYDGKSFDQWKQEFGQREAAMAAVRKRVDEIDVLLKKSPIDKEQSQALVAERNKATEQFTEMRKQYDQFAEQARKAGIQVNITP